MDIEFIRKDYYNSFIHMERYVNNPKNCGFPGVLDVSQKYLPHGGASSFELFSPLNGAQEIMVKGSCKHSRAVEKNYPFFFHPDSGYDCLMEPSGVFAVPTSSVRTVAVTGLFQEPVFIETSLPKKIFSFSGNLNFTDVLHSMSVCYDVKDLCLSFKDFACLDEFAGSSYQGIGCIFRKFSAYPEKKGYLIPAFSLFSSDYLAHNDDLLIGQLSIKIGWSVKNLLKYIIGGVISLWCEAAINKGFLLELSAKNLLLEIDEDFFPQRLVVRNFSSIRVDGDARIVTGLDCCFNQRVVGKSTPFSKDIAYSLAYDYFTCRHFLFPLIQTCCEKYGLDKKEFTDFAKSVFLEKFTSKANFPAKPFGYSIDFFNKNVPQLIELSRFRPLR